MTKKTENYFIKNYNSDVSEHIEKKGNGEYVSWDIAYKLVKERDVNFSFKYIKDPNGRPYFIDGERIWCEVETSMCGHTVTEIFPFMEGNKAVPTSKVTNFTLNKQLKRALVKAISLHGIGLRLWTREDLIDEEKENKPQPKQENKSPINILELQIEVRKVKMYNDAADKATGVPTSKNNSLENKVREFINEGADQRRIINYLERCLNTAIELYKKHTGQDLTDEIAGYTKERAIELIKKQNEKQD